MNHNIFFHAGLVDGRGYVNILKKETMDIHMHRSILNYAIKLLQEHNDRVSEYLSLLKSKIQFSAPFSNQKNATDQKIYGAILLIEKFIHKHESAFSI